MYRLFLLSVLAFSLLFAVSAQGLKNIDSKVFSSLISSNEGIILDVRTPQEYTRGHIENSTLISTNDPKFLEKVSLLQKDKPIYVYCLSGSRSYAVANYLSKNGYSSVYNLSRGLLEWQGNGYPLTKNSNTMANNTKTYTNSEFNSLINSKNLVLIDFHAPWCAPCKKMAPIIDEIKNDYFGKAAVKKVDIQENKLLQSSYKIESIPGIVLFKNGKEVWRHTGLISYAELSTVINQYLSL